MQGLRACLPCSSSPFLIKPPASLVERHLRDSRRDRSAPNSNFHQRVRSSILDRNVGHSYVLLKIWRRAARNHMAYLLPVYRDGVTIPRRCAVLDNEAGQLPGHALSFLPLDHLAADKIAFAELHRPTQTRLDRCRRLIHVVSPESER